MNSPRGIGCCYEEVDDHSVKHVQAMFHSPAGKRRRASGYAGVQNLLTGVSGAKYIICSVRLNL